MSEDKTVARPSPWRGAIPVLTLLAGMVFVAAGSTAHGTDLRVSGRSRVGELIAEERRGNRRLERRLRLLHEEVDALTRRAAERDAGVRRARSAAAGPAAEAGFTPVRGLGVTVVLDDAPRSVRSGNRLPGDPGPDDLVVHQEDVQAVVNALWLGGATAMRVMDQRVITTSAVRCVGNTLILRGVVYSPPFRVSAVGDPDRLRAALAASPAIATYQQYVAAYGLGYRVTEARLALPAYSSPITLRHARVAERAHIHTRRR